MADALPKKEHPSTYFVVDGSNDDELTRLKIQDEIITRGMGGVWPEQADPSCFKRILDVACGTGGWLIQIAQEHPTVELLVGVDISLRMIEYARAQAALQHVDKRVEFHVMDTLRMLEFPMEFFDLINLRLGGSYLRAWDWRKLLEEFQRVARFGGIVRIIESDVIGESSSSALNTVCDMIVNALHRAGHFFTPDHDGLIREVPHLLCRYGLSDVQTRTSVIEYRGGTADGVLFLEDMRHVFRNVRPFLQKWGRLPTDYDDICRQAMEDIARPDFVAHWTMVTVWGNKLS